MKSKKTQKNQNVADGNCDIDPFEEWGLTFDAIPDHVALIGLDMRLTKVNKAFALQVGKKPEDLVGEPCYRYICGRESNEHCPHRLTIKDGKTHTIELQLEHLGGDYIVTTSPLRDRKGHICGSVHVAHDITDSKKASDALRQSETRFRGLVEQSLVGIYILRDEQFLYVNPKLAEIFGYASPDEIVFGKQTLDLIAPESRAVVAENDRKRLEGGEPSVHYLFRGLRKDGTVIDVEAYGSRTEIDGRPAIIGTLLDITEKLRLERQQRALEERLHLQQRQQSIATLAGGIAHDFNNMLMGVLGGAELLKGKLPPGAKERELADTIIETSRRMAGLTRQLLNYSRHGTYKHTTTRPNMIIQSAIDLMRKDLPAVVTIREVLADDLWPVIADASQLDQVIVNIITNAVEAIEKSRGQIEIRTENVAGKTSWECPLSQHPSGDYVHLSIGDTGPGIPLNMQKKIFEPFYTTKFMGRGLGLASALGIIQDHGGCLSVESAPGKGSIFHIYLPRGRETAGGTKHGRRALGSVLVVDDEPDVLSLLKAMLTELGYEPLVAENSADALNVFAERRGDVRLAILDVQLSGTDGADLFNKLKSLQPGLKVLISSGYDESTALARFGAERPDGFIQKPYWIDALRDKVTDVLQGGNGGG